MRTTGLKSFARRTGAFAGALALVIQIALGGIFPAQADGPTPFWLDPGGFCVAGDDGSAGSSPPANHESEKPHDHGQCGLCQTFHGTGAGTAPDFVSLRYWPDQAQRPRQPEDSARRRSSLLTALQPRAPPARRRALDRP